jgi:hypothetical protein
MGVCEKILAQNVTQSIFVKIKTSLYPWKKVTKKFISLCNRQKTATCKESPIRRKFAQSGLPVYLPPIHATAMHIKSKEAL